MFSFFQSLQKKFTFLNLKRTSKINLHHSKKFIIQRVRAIIMILFLFKKKKIASLAQSLAFTTIISMVPIFAIFFFIVGIVTGSNQAVQEKIKHFISTYFIPNHVSWIIEKIEELSSVSVAFGVIGVPTLFLIGVMLYVKVDHSINEIWDTNTERQWFKNSAAFFMTVFLGPMLLVLALSIPTYLQALPFYKQVLSLSIISSLSSQFLPITIATIILFTLYLYIPVVHVHYRAAFWGALNAAVLLQISNALVNIYLVNFSNFNLIYRSLAFIPIVLFWIFIVWCVVLVGGLITYCVQHYSHVGYAEFEQEESNESLLRSALRLLIYIVICFRKKNAAPDFQELHIKLSIPRERLSYILKKLQHEKIITAFQDLNTHGNTSIRYQPALLASEITLKEIIQLFSNVQQKSPFKKDLEKLLNYIEIHPNLLFETISIKDFIQNPNKIITLLVKGN